MAGLDFVVKNGLQVNTNLIVANAGKVGINNSSPDAALTVTGTANVSGNVTLNGGQATINSNLALSSANVTITSNTFSVKANSTVTAISVVGNSTSTNTIVRGNTWSVVANAVYSGLFTAGANATFSGGLVTSSANVNVTGTNLNSAANVNLTGTNVAVSANLSLTGTIIGTNLNSSANVSMSGQVFTVTSNTQSFKSNSTVTALSIVGNSTATNVAFTANTIDFKGANLAANGFALFNNVVNMQAGANVTGNLRVSGDLVVSGNLTSSGTASADFLPASNGYFLGNTTARWSLFGNSITLSSTANVTGNSLFGTTTLFVDTTNGRVGVGNVTPANTFVVGGWIQLVGTSGVRFSDGTTQSTAANTAAAGSNTYLQFNDSGLANGTSQFTADKATGNMFVNGLFRANNSIVANSGTSGAPSFTFNGNTDTGIYNSTTATLAITTGGSVAWVINSTFNSVTSKIAVGTGAANTQVNLGNVSVANSTGTANVHPYGLSVGTAFVNAGSVGVGANVVVNATTVWVGNSTVNTTITAAAVSVANSSGTTTLAPGQFSVPSFNASANVQVGSNVTLDTVKLSIGNTTANMTVNSVILTVQDATGTANVTPTAFVTGGAVVNTSVIQLGANAVVGFNQVSVGNSTINSIVNSTSLVVSNTSTTSTINSGAIQVGNSTFFGYLSFNGAAIQLKLANSTVNTGISLPSASQYTNAANTFLAANGSWVQIDTSGFITATTGLFTANVSVGNSTVNATVSTNSTGSWLRANTIQVEVANVTTLNVASIVGTAVANVTNFFQNTASKFVMVETIWGSTIFQTVTDAANCVVNCAAGVNFKLTLGGNRNIDSPTNVKEGQSGTFRVVQDGTGNRVPTWGSAWKAAGGTLPTLSTAAGAEDWLFYQCVNSTFTYIGYARDVK